jgi:GH24 family phage-related lysozyme (muramidase)
MAEPTETFLAHLKLREGEKSKVYLDTLDKPTVGVGHLLTDEEKKLYPVGTEVGEEVIKAWLKNDSTKAYNAAKTQLAEINIDDQPLLEALGSVNYQLGVNWRDKFPSAWTAMKEGDFTEAVKQIKTNTKGGKSAWLTQTPTRVEDFENALTTYGKAQDTAFLKPDSGIVESVVG